MKILIVEDEQNLRETIGASLQKEKFVVETADNYFRLWIRLTITITTVSYWTLCSQEETGWICCVN